MGQCYSSSRKNRLVAKHGYVGNKYSHNLKTPRTTLTQPQSPTSIIIPEITEHVNHSFSSSDEDEDALHMMQQQIAPPLSSELNNLATKNSSKGMMMDGDRHPLAQDARQLTSSSQYNITEESEKDIAVGDNSWKAPTSLHSATTSRYSRNQMLHGYSKRTNHSTSLITVQRERLRSINFNSDAASSTLPTETNEDLVYSSDDGSSSPAVLRRLIAQTKSRLKSTGRILHHEQHPSVTSATTSVRTSFSQVHESLTKTTIIEEDGEAPGCHIAATSVSTMPKPEIIDSTAAPSDEEDGEALSGRCTRTGTSKISTMYIEPDPALPSLSRRRKSRHNATTNHVVDHHTAKSKSAAIAMSHSKFNHRLERIGPLSPVKLKTSHCVSPQSIRVFDDDCQTDNDIPAIHSVSTSRKRNTDISDTAATTTLDVTPNTVHVNNTNEEEEAAIDTRTIHNFTKLKLQIQVAARQAQKERLIHKVEDRMNDVQQHRQLWDVYQNIQSNISTAENKERTIRDDDNVDVETKQDADVSEDDVAAMTQSKNICSIDLANSVTSETPKVGQVRRRKPRRFLRKVNRDTTRKEMISPATIVQAPVDVTSPVEYDLEDDTQIITKKKSSPQRRISSKQSKLDSHVTVPAAVDETSKNESEVNETAAIGITSTKKQPRVRSNSFDLHQTETWFFDFQGEFQNDPKHETKPVLTNHSPIDHYNNDNMSSNNSQANLSLLSANSLEVQKRLYAEKRRQRKTLSSNMNSATATSTPKGLPGFLLTDNTPQVRNGTNRGSHRTVSSYDYGPLSQCRSPFLSDVQSSPCHMGGGSAQELYNAPTEAEKIRIAKEILRRRNVTNMEVTFRTPKSGRQNNSTVGNDNGDNVEIDNSSFVSDLDESYTSHHTHRSNHSYTSYDYGPQRRPARRHKRYNMDGDGEDQSSIVSDVSFDLSHKMDNILNAPDEGVTKGKSNNNDAQSKSNSTYDFQSIVQRRLDIEERLRALMSSDDHESSMPSANTLNKTVKSEGSKGESNAFSMSNHKCDETGGKSSTEHSTTLNSDPNLITPNGNVDRTTIVANVMDANHHDNVNPSIVNKSFIVTPNAKDTYQDHDASSAKGRSDFSRLLDAVEVDRPSTVNGSALVSASSGGNGVAIDDTIVHNKEHECTILKQSTDATLCDSHRALANENSYVMDRNPLSSRSITTTVAAVTSLSVINESYESNESPNSTNPMKLPLQYLQDRVCNERSSTPRFDSTSETLRLAHDVETKVNNILERYRQNDDTAFPTTTPNTIAIGHEPRNDTITKVHVIEASSP